MAKFLILYNSSSSARETMAQSSPEQMQASMDEWLAWRDEAVKTAEFEFGSPLQAEGRVTPEGVTASDIPVSGYSIMAGESKEVIATLLQSHPHLKRQGATIDVLEMLAMPGM